MIRSLVPHAEEVAIALGHDICWDTIGENVAHGHCSRCSLPISIAQSREGIIENHGQVLEHACPNSAQQPNVQCMSPAKRP